MSINYYVSPRLLKKGIPFWIFPLTLFILLVIVLLWTLIITQHTSVSKSFNSVEKSFNSQSNSVNIMYESAVENFKNGSYYTASQQFQSIYNQNNISQNMKESSGVFYAFSLLIEGSNNYNAKLVEKSYYLYKKMLKNTSPQSAYYARMLMGYTQAIRFLGLNYDAGIDRSLSYVSLLPANKNIKKQLELELAYYYFFNNNYVEANKYFLQARLYIDSAVFFETLVNRENTDLFLLNLLDNQLITNKLLISYGMQIKQKLMKSVMVYIRNGNFHTAKNILKSVGRIFSSDSVMEDVNFLFGYMAQKEQNYIAAIKYYEQVISNGFLDKDAVSLFQMGIIYYHLGNKDNSAYYFNMLVKKFSYTYYAAEARKWLDYYYPKRSGASELRMTPPATPVLELDNQVMPDKQKLPVIKEQPLPYNNSTNTNTNNIQGTTGTTEPANTTSNSTVDNRPVVNVNIDHSTHRLTNADGTYPVTQIYQYPDTEAPEVIIQKEPETKVEPERNFLEDDWKVLDTPVEKTKSAPIAEKPIVKKPVVKQVERKSFEDSPSQSSQTVKNVQRKQVALGPSQEYSKAVSTNQKRINSMLADFENI